MVGGAARKQQAPRHVTERFGLEQALDRIPLRRALGGPDEQAASEPSVGKGCNAIDAALLVEIFGERGSW